MSDYAHPEVLVDTQWLKEHLHDPNVRVVEVDTSNEVFQDAHIPGAVFWHIFGDILLPTLGINLDPTNIERLLARSGITNTTTVIAYGSYPGTGAWIFWLLKLFGHQDVRVLNGGYQQWKLKGLPLSKDLSSYPESEYSSSASVNINLRVLPEEVKASIGDTKKILLDVRTLAEYRGEHYLMKPTEEGELAGHIPTAIHLEHIQTMNEDGTFKTREELQALFESKGITADKEIFPYCAVGGRSAGIWFVLKYLLGYPEVRNYDGSWNQWSRLPDAPIETNLI